MVLKPNASRGMPAPLWEKRNPGVSEEEVSARIFADGFYRRSSEGIINESGLFDEEFIF